MKDSGAYNMALGIFSDLQGLEMDMQYFSDQRLDHFAFSNQTKELTRDQIMDYFAKQNS